MSDSILVSPCCKDCWHSPSKPCRDLIACLDHGPLCHHDDACRELRASRLLSARRGGDGTLIFVGAGTCGLANGSSKIIASIRAFLEAHGIQARIIETGCVGFCQREVFVDIQTADLPPAQACPRTGAG